MATFTSLFVVGAILLVAVNSYNIERKLKADFNELQQDVEEMIAVKKENDSPFEKRAENLCKYPGSSCYNGVYSYGCRLKSVCLTPGKDYEKGTDCFEKVCITLLINFNNLTMKD